MSRVFSRDPRFDATKVAITQAVRGTDHPGTREWAVKRWGKDGAPLEVTKGETPSYTVTDLDPNPASGVFDRELFKSVQSRALLFRLRGLRRTGFRVRSTTIANGTAVFVEEGAAIPVLQAEIAATGLDPAKIAALTVWTQEALQESPGIEELVFNDLSRAWAEAADFAMFNPANDGSGAAPASVTYGAPAFAASSDIGEDIALMFAAFDGDLSAAYVATTPQIAAGLSALPIGKDCGARGGELAGIPLLTSAAFPEGQMTLVDPSAVMAAWDEMLEIETSRHGTIEMLDANLAMDAIDVVPGTAASLVGMFQTNCAAIRCLGRVVWAAARPATVSITGLFPAAS